MNVEIGIIATLIGISLSYLGYRKGVLDEYKKKGEHQGNISTDIKYIREKTDDVLLEQKDIRRSLDGYSERLVRVEESSKQAHKRIDGIEGRD